MTEPGNGGHSDDGRDLTPTADLLNLVFGFQPPIGSDLLNWYYRENPEGAASVGRRAPMVVSSATTPWCRSGFTRLTVPIRAATCDWGWA